MRSRGDRESVAGEGRVRARRFGFGKAAALALAEAGAHLVIQGHSRMAELEALAERIIRLGRRAVPVRADVTSTEDVDRLVRTAVDELGGVDVAFNNAGLIP